MKKRTSDRFWEIDFFRGFAVILMIVFHFLYDLNYFGIYKLDLYTGFFLVYMYAGASLFLLLVGISLSLSYSRVKTMLTMREIQWKYLTRGLKIFGLGLLVTLATWLYLQEGFIVFGALHCIGVSIILAMPFLRFRIPNLLIGSLFIIIGVSLRTFVVDFTWLVWLGLRSSRFYTVDYFPLLPWFGVVLIGIFLGNVLYPDYKRVFRGVELSMYPPVRLFCFLGRHSLLIYFLHQPILIGLIHLLA